MTGPEHYRQAERLIAVARTFPDRADDTNPAAELTLQVAQVHATLALAAATALRGEVPRSDGFDEYRAWQRVAGAEGSEG